MSPERLKEIRSREAAATIGPWIQGIEHTDTVVAPNPEWNPGTSTDTREWYGHPLIGETIMSEADRAFIAHAREDIRDLLEIVEHVYEGWGPGVSMIALERRGHKEREGWTPEHDDGHTGGELAAAAVAYTLASSQGSRVPRYWPWSLSWWKPTSPIRMLIKAGALIAAEIDRRIRKGESAE
jgi:hypothetical protein